MSGRDSASRALVPKDLDAAAAQLTDMQRTLVEKIVITGMSQKDAAIEAGYSPDNAQSIASITLAKPHVGAYLHALMLSRLSSSAPLAMSAIEGLVRDAKSEYVKLEAAKDLLDRAGFKPIERKQVASAGEVKVVFDLG